MGRSRYKLFQDEVPHFMTCTIVQWLPLFGFERITTVILESLRFLIKEERLTVYAYVIMEHHLHLVASSSHLSNEMGDFKSFTARTIIDMLEDQHSEFWLSQLRLHKARHKKDRQYQFWQ
ncbi:MAG: transposase, partial [Bacteroidetes bacterium]